MLGGSCSAGACTGMLSIPELEFPPLFPRRAPIFSFLKPTPWSRWHVKLVTLCDNSEDTWALGIQANNVFYWEKNRHS